MLVAALVEASAQSAGQQAEPAPRQAAKRTAQKVNVGQGSVRGGMQAVALKARAALRPGARCQGSRSGQTVQYAEDDDENDPAQA